ncbi:MAG: YcaO-related McrA-glycine thioamidation protein [Methanospirillaceae archaeon]|nr:YcaO-related McrA-glycine thioamidation protein [Methanospirillaceae archaeon]
MLLSPCRKLYKKETHRAVSPEETLNRVESFAPVCGITRVADITDLDRIGIPVFSCIRPSAARGAISVYNGKGVTEITARVSAIMEGIERFSAEPDGHEILLDSFSSLSKNENALAPRDLIIPRGTNHDDLYPWMRGYDIMNNEPIWVPAHAVSHPVPEDYTPLFKTNTNGLASGNTIEEAIYHALCEIIERDAWSLVEASHNAGPVIQDIEDPTALDLLSRFEDAGVRVLLRDITSDIGIPTVAAVADDLQLRDPALLTIGMGTHSCPEVAIFRALTEVAQSRATQIHGAREDTTEGLLKAKIGYERTKRINRKWFSETETVQYRDISRYESDDFLHEILYITEKLAAVGCSRVIVSDLTLPDIGVPVVRVIVPGLEMYAVDSARMGDRCRYASRRSLSGAKSVGS